MTAPLANKQLPVIKKDKIDRLLNLVTAPLANKQLPVIKNDKIDRLLNLVTAPLANEHTCHKKGQDR